MTAPCSFIEEESGVILSPMTFKTFVWPHNPRVYAITYESGTVYVNYGSEAYTIGSGETVPAESGRFVPFSAEQRTRGE